MSDPRPEATSTEHPARIPPRRLWFAILVPPAVWIAQGSLGWFFGERGCTTMSLTTVRTVTGLISLAALGAVIAALIVGWGNWHRTSPHPDVRHVEGWDRMDFMAASGFLVSSIFVLGVVWAGLSSVFINVCGGTR